MQILQFFIVLRQPVVNSVTVFSNPTKLTNYLFMQWICGQSWMTVLSRDWEEDVPERLRRYFSQFFTGNIRFPGNGIRERRPLKCVSLTKTGIIGKWMNCILWTGMLMLLQIIIVNASTTVNRKGMSSCCMRQLQCCWSFLNIY